MTANRILTVEHVDLVPASAAGREQVARRESPPKNTISNAEIGELIGPEAISRDTVAKGSLRDIALQISRKTAAKG
jgi:predicted kinase